jgi:hypothetical protein
MDYLATLPRTLQLSERPRSQRPGKACPSNPFLQTRDLGTSNGIFNGPAYGT